MEILKFNSENLRDDEIDEVVVRVKVFLFNENNEILIATSNGGCQLPGGHIESGEDLIEGVVREVQEETGIILDKNEVYDPFFEINHYTKNHKNKGLNRVSKVVYYKVVTNKTPNLENLNLTETEKMYGFSAHYVKEIDFKEYVTEYLTVSEIEINKIIAKEILLAFEYLNK